MLARNVFDRRCVLMWYKETDQNISPRSLILFILAVGWALCGQPQPEHESVIPLLSVTFSLKCFNQLKLSSV